MTMDATARFLSFGVRAGRAHLNEGVALNDAVAKLASAEDLNQLQIQRVVEFANHTVNDALRAKAQDKTFRFDLASTDGVLAKLAETPKGVAETDVRRTIRAFVGCENSSASLQKTAGLITEPAERTQVRRLILRDNLEKIAARLKQLQRIELSKLAGVHEALRRGVRELTQYAQDHVFHGGTVADLHKFACCARPNDGHAWDVLFTDVRERLIKQAKHDSGAPSAAEAYGKFAKQPPIPKSDQVPYTVVNGNHRLLILLDTLRNKISDEDRSSQRLRLMDTHGPAVVVGIKAFDDSRDVRRYIDSDVRPLPSSETVEKLASVCLTGDVDAVVAELEKVAGLISATKTGLKWGKRALGLGAGLGLLSASMAAGKALRPIARPWRPGAERGVNQGGAGPELV